MENFLGSIVRGQTNKLFILALWKILPMKNFLFGNTIVIKRDYHGTVIDMGNQKYRLTFCMLGNFYAFVVVC